MAWRLLKHEQVFLPFEQGVMLLPCHQQSCTTPSVKVTGDSTLATHEHGQANYKVAASKKVTSDLPMQHPAPPPVIPKRVLKFSGTSQNKTTF